MLLSLPVFVAVYGVALGAGAESVILATANASCTNRFLGKARARFGFNDGLWNGGPTFADPRYAHVLRESGGLLLRYPGGSCASYWNWTTGSFCSLDSNPLCIDKPPQYVTRPGQQYKLNDVVNSLATIGEASGLVIDLNPVSDTLQHQLQFVRTAIAYGANVAAIELGNEIYYGEAAVGARFPTVSTYLSAMEVWAKALRAEWPEIPIVIPVLFDGFFGDHNNRTTTWNSAIASWIKQHGRDAAREGRWIVDGLQVHTYYFNGIDSNPALNSPTYLCADTAGKGLLWGDAADQTTMFDRLASNASDWVRTMLAVPFDGYSNYTQQIDEDFAQFMDGGAAQGPPLGTFATEFNMLAYCGPSRLTWAHALYTSTLALLMLRDGRRNTQLALYHDATGNPLFSSIYYFPETLQGMCCGRYRDVTMYSPTATGLGFGYVLSPASTDATHACAIDFSPQPTAPGYRNYTGNTYPTLLGAYFERINPANGTVVLFNLSPEERQVQLFPASTPVGKLWPRSTDDVQGGLPTGQTGARTSSASDVDKMGNGRGQGLQPVAHVLTGEFPGAFATNGLDGEGGGRFRFGESAIGDDGVLVLPPLSMARVDSVGGTGHGWSCSKA